MSETTMPEGRRRSQRVHAQRRPSSGADTRGSDDGLIGLSLLAVMVALPTDVTTAVNPHPADLVPPRSRC